MSLQRLHILYYENVYFLTISGPTLYIGETLLPDSYGQVF